MLSLKTISLSEAKLVADAARAKADSEGWKVVIAIVDVGGRLVYLERGDGVQLASIEVSEAKARTALMFRRPSKALEDVILGGRSSLLSFPSEFTLIDGGLPLVHDSDIVGAIGVSGLTSAQDAEVAQAGVDALAAL